ncbi:MAG: helix-turn-helix transcriptional regulator [Sphingomonas sp.]|nr:helix-turn-helix transcriptional regulator [Sphingomonas sp.]
MVRTSVPQLTERQRACLQGFLERKTAKEIGRELGIGHHGVEQHLKAARKKLGAQSTAEAARLYFSSNDTTDEPYYAPSELPAAVADEACLSEPGAGRLLLRDIAAEGPRLVQTLSARQTLMAIGLSGVGMITILSLIIAVADGVKQLTN